MKLEILISTMHQTDYTVLDRIGLQSDAIVVNQCNCDSEEIFMVGDYRVTWVNSTQRGLSRSRNTAIAYASADVLLLVDDDEILRPDYAETILAGFKKYKDAAVIGFQVKGIEEKFKDYTLYEGQVGYLKSMKMSSVEIAFTRNALKDSHVSFNERIGAGTKYMMGEENTFLFQLLNKKQKIYYIPNVIADLHIGESTWFNGFNREYMHARGAVFTAMNKRWSDLLICQFAVRHRRAYQENMSMWNAIQYMMAGKKEFLSDNHKTFESQDVRKISVVTPTYNRAYILPQCYQSLVEQTCMDFEWIVVDDGSTDQTEELVNSYIREGKIPITYIKQENGGKHRAHNRGVLAAKGELCVCLDSDDQLTEDAIATAKEFWIQHAKENNIGLLAKRGSIAERTPICSSWPEELIECTMFELNNVYEFKGDTALFFRTDLLKQNLFSEFPNEKFLPETNLYYALDRYGSMLLMNRVVYLCEYLPDGLTARFHRLLRDNPLGTANTYFKGIQCSKRTKGKIKQGLLTNIYLSLCKNEISAGVDKYNFWVVITKIPAAVIGKRFLRRFE